MQTLAYLLVIVAAACAIARPSGPTAAPAPTSMQAREVRPLQAARQEVGPLQAAREEVGPLRAAQDGVRPLPAREEVRPLLAPAPLHILLRRFLGYHEARPPMPPALPENYWLNEEINRISQIKDEDRSANPYNVDLARWLAQGPNMRSILKDPLLQESIEYDVTKSIRTNFEDTPTKPGLLPKRYKIQQEDKDFFRPRSMAMNNNRQAFALTPIDNGYFETDETMKESSETMEGVGHQEGGVPISAIFLEPQRQIRQNPNLSKQKHLLGPQLVNLNSAHSHKSEAVSEVTDWPQHTHMVETEPAEPTDSFYGVAILAVICAALTTAIVGFAFGWRSLSKKAKAAAESDYPAYGVTGPTIDTSGDRKLAHSAHMYHYQHQKQQIIAMERTGLEQRNGSISDPESEEENEEGDYTVYECPGFATTGEMEVANPLFSEDPMVATPGKCETVKPQRKE